MEIHKTVGRIDAMAWQLIIYQRKYIHVISASIPLHTSPMTNQHNDIVISI